MKIVHIIKVKGLAGAETHLVSLLHGLLRRGHEITLMLLCEERDDAFPVTAACIGNMQIYVVKIRGSLDPLCVLQLWSFLRGINPDIVHTHLIHADLHGLLAARLARVPVLVSTRHNDLAIRCSWPARVAWRWAGRLAARTIVISQYLANALRGEVQSPVVIHYGLDGWQTWQGKTEHTRDQIRRKLAARGVMPNPQGFLAVVVGRLIPEKGHDWLLKAWGQVVKKLPEARLLVVGDGPLRKSLQEQAGPGVAFAGWLDHEEALQTIAAADVLVCPSRHEGFGLVLLEAMALNTPIVASDIGPLPEIVGDAGVLVPLDNEDALAGALLTMASGLTSWYQWRRIGRRRVAERFSLTNMVSKTEGLYQELYKEVADAIGG